MRCIIIDVETKQVKEATIPETGDSGTSFIRGVVGGYFQSAGVVAKFDDGEDVLFVDEEGLLKEKPGSFGFARMNHPTQDGFEGNGIIVGVDAKGETVGARTSLAEVRQKVAFVRP